MAYIDQAKKAQIAQALKIALQNTGLKFSLSLRHHSTLVMNIYSGPIDFVGECENPHSLTHIDVNPYHYETHFKDGKAKDILRTVFSILNMGNHDNSDPQSDYFDVGWYVDVNIGKYQKPYELTGGSNG